MSPFVLSLSDPNAKLEMASQVIHQLFMQAAIPAPIAETISQAYTDLYNRSITQSPNRPMAVAVRSSATAEDLPDASFAGQQETYLNIQGAEAVLVAVQKCWASLWTGRAIAYRLRQGILPETVALAVVVQLLAPAEAAGVLFTANPMNGRRDEIVIDAAWGLGEAIVGGRVTPDTLIADKATGRIKQSQVADKAVIMETGGPISHSAIVAREYGIPAVVGVSEATTRLHTGQRLRVNGAAGEITCLD
jgi:phosphoenolpyruvate synthase/pyruvate phosphate dikinase